jgi:hypothetical protein
MNRDFLRHTLATLAYRGAKAIANAPPAFADFAASPTSRTPLQILTHLGDLLEWANQLAQGRYVYREETPSTWESATERFFAELATLDVRLAAAEPSEFSDELIFQGPIADALTHVGQINMLRRMAGSPVRGESYARAQIVMGRVGPDQSTVRVEFD